MKILILNLHSMQNAGDLAILDESISILKICYPNSNITYTLNNEDNIFWKPNNAIHISSFVTWLAGNNNSGEWKWKKTRFIFYFPWILILALIYRIFQWEWKPKDKTKQDLMNLFYSSDIIVSFGGGHFYASRTISIAFLWNWVIMFASIIMKKPLVLFPQSIGPIEGNIQRYMTKILLNRCSLISVREYESANLIKKIGVNREILFIPDLAFSLNRYIDKDIRINYVDHRLRIGFTVMDWRNQNNPNFDQRNYEESLICLIIHAIQHYDADITIFSQVYGPSKDQDDRIIATRIYESIKQKGFNISVDLNQYSHIDLVEIYSHLDIMISTRMHSSIICSCSYVPSLTIGYLYKSVGVMSILGLRDYVISINDINPHVLIAMFETLYRDRYKFSSLLRSRVPKYISSIEYLSYHMKNILS